MQYVTTALTTKQLKNAKLTNAYNAQLTLTKEHSTTTRKALAATALIMYYKYVLASNTLTTLQKLSNENNINLLENKLVFLQKLENFSVLHYSTILHKFVNNNALVFNVALILLKVLKHKKE